MNDNQLKLILNDFLRKQKPQFVFDMVSKKYGVELDQFWRVASDLINTDLKTKRSIVTDVTTFGMRHKLFG